MDNVQETIVKFLPYFCDNLCNLKTVILHLIQEEIISLRESEMVLQSTGDQHEELFQKVLPKTRDEKSQDVFLCILEKTGNEALAQKIRNPTANNEMESKIKKVITKNLVFLTEQSCNLVVLRMKLVGDGFITSDEGQEMGLQQDDYSIVWKILLKKDLSSRWELLLEVLKQCGLNHIAEKLGQELAQV